MGHFSSGADLLLQRKNRLPVYDGLRGWSSAAAAAPGRKDGDEDEDVGGILCGPGGGSRKRTTAVIRPNSAASAARVAVDNGPPIDGWVICWLGDMLVVSFQGSSLCAILCNICNEWTFFPFPGQ
ncbi:hypothetical protein VaNZ11_013894 [Volvox africanus]|uniref:Uncharacterized protein n=1 Tax=Volvox africanus TaxID=51714 RepID=A0ABQ5SIR1_9CHLO|nr:hypothetical protein VaNZ11_013894 [Volvox africanus]